MRAPCFILAATALVFAGSAAAATPTPASATITITIPAAPPASVMASIRQAMKNIPNFSAVVKTGGGETLSSPPGVLKFARGEVNRLMGASPATVVAVYAASLPDGRKGRLIVLKFPRSSPSAVVQLSTQAFKLHEGERVILIRSGGWSRVLPYNGRKLLQ